MAPHRAYFARNAVGGTIAIVVPPRLHSAGSMNSRFSPSAIGMTVRNSLSRSNSAHGGSLGFSELSL